MNNEQALWQALFEVTKELSKVGLDAKGQYGQYVSLEHVIETVKPVLEKNGLMLLQPIMADDHAAAPNLVVTQIVHVESGATAESRFRLLSDKPGPQGQGAAVTYARRYSILSLLGLATSEDPDAQHQQRGDLPPIAQGQLQGATNPGWIVPFGKFINRAFDTIPLAEAQNYAAYLRGLESKDGKPLRGNAATFVQLTEAKTAALGTMPAVTGFAEDIPF